MFHYDTITTTMKYNSPLDHTWMNGPSHDSTAKAIEVNCAQHIWSKNPKPLTVNSLKNFKNPGSTGPFGTENIQKTTTRGSVILKIKKNQVP